MSSIEDAVVAKIDARAAKGLSNYGVTMDREDLTTLEWLTHLQEELLDATIYVEKVLHIARNPELHGDM